MMFFKRLFGRKEKPAADQPRDYSTQQTQAEQDETRGHMEAEVAADRERRGATDEGPGSEEAPAEGSGSATASET